MDRTGFARWWPHGKIPAAAVLLALLGLPPPSAWAGGKVGLYAVRMVPQNRDARRFSGPAWGGGLQTVVPVSPLGGHLAGVVGLELVNLLSTTDTRTDQDGFRLEQSTSQDYFRLYLGGELGPHGRGFLRPHAGANLAFVYYDITSTLTRPNDQDPSQSLVQELGSRGRAATGFDLTLGMDFNLADRFSLDGGVRYVKTFGVPQQLGDGSMTVYPDYFQIYAGVGLSFGLIGRIGAPDVEVTDLGRGSFPKRTGPGEIDVFTETPTSDFIEIALVRVEGGSFSKTRSDVLKALRKRASDLGGDGVIIKRLGEEEDLLDAVVIRFVP